MIEEIFNKMGYSRTSHEKSGVLARDYDPQGVWTKTMKGIVARQVQPRLYESLREAIPLIDGCINRLVTMDGILKIEGESDKIQRVIQDWADEVKVGDMQHGLQSFYALQSNEMYEQGFTMGEFVLNQQQNNIDQLNVADSKGIHFLRPETGPLQIWYKPPTHSTGRMDGTDQIERILRNNLSSSQVGGAYLREQKYRQLLPESMIYAGFNVEADNAYGVSLMRSMEFVSKILLTIENATEQTWVRFGDPIFNVVYKTNNRNASNKETLDDRKATIAATIAAAFKSKRQGKSVDIINAVGKDDSIDMKILGADGMVLDLEQPVRHMEEQIIGKSGLPSWMVGRHWSTAERLAQRQGEIVIQESKTRFSNRKQGLKNVVANMLRARGISWKTDDWDVVQDLPSLQDLVAKAQASFLEAQTELMLSKGQPSTATVDTDESGKTVIHIPASAFNQQEGNDRLGKSFSAKSEGFAEDGSELPKLETEALSLIVEQWQSVYTDVLTAIDIENINEEDLDSDDLDDDVESDSAPVFIYAALMLPAILLVQEKLVDLMATEEPVLVDALIKAYEIGVNNAVSELGIDAISSTVFEEVRQQYLQSGMTMIRDKSVSLIKEDVLLALQNKEYDGLNYKDVAKKLKQRFGLLNYDWERLARSEISIAQVAGKMDTYEDQGIKQYNYKHAKDSKVSTICRRNARKGPYDLGKGPLPVTDSHPNCRCTVTSFIPTDS